MRDLYVAIIITPCALIIIYISIPNICIILLLFRCIQKIYVLLGTNQIGSYKYIQDAKIMTADSGVDIYATTIKTTGVKTAFALFSL